MSSASTPGLAERALFAAGTASYDCPDFPALDKVPEALRTVVGVLKGLGFTTVAGTPGYDLDPVLMSLRTAVKRAAAAAPVVVVYYTGHGTDLERGTYYLVGKKSRPTDLDESALAARDLLTLLTRRDDHGVPLTEQPTVLIILDCCYSGSAGMTMLGEALRGTGNTNTWVIASAGPLEYAQQGLFAMAFRDALQRPTAGSSQRFLSLEVVAQAINDVHAGRAQQQARVFPPPTGLTGTPPFFPNPQYQPGLAGMTVADQQHWLSRVHGGPRESTTGFYLAGRTGRIRAAQDLIGWMRDPDRGGLAVVTGRPGTGKSTLLALPVLLAQPDRRADLLAGARPGSLIERAATLLPAGTPVAAVHARGLNADQAARVIAEAFGLVSNSAATLLQDLKTSPQERAVVVVDALDEAVSPPDVVADLLLPLGKAGLRVAVGGRRPAVPSAAQLTIDLDRPGYQDPEALADYLRRLLVAAEEPGVRTPYRGIPDEVTAAVAAAIAQRATSGDGRTESFLIGRILALSVRGRPEPADVTSPDWQARLPAELTEAFDEDLGRLGERTPLARTLLEALAWAQGNGLPWENIWVPVARALAGHRPPLITDDDVRWLLDKAGAYVVEDLGPGQRSVYRPFHDVLAAYLRGEPSDPEPGSAGDLAAKDAWDRHRSETEKVITNALLETVPVDATGQRQWDTAHPYLKTYLFQHAADTGTEAASALAQDLSFLAVTDQVTFSPYRGLAAYGPGDAQFFFGREDETSAVITLMAKRLEKPELLIVSGPSGVGKSSLLEAGVLVALRRGALPAPGAESWPIIVFTPGRAPLLELASRTAALAGTDPATVLHGLDGLQIDPAAFADTARQAVLAASTRAAGDHEAMQQPQPRLLIIVDQFEQLFTMCSDEEERRTFITALHAAATTRFGPARVSPALVMLGVRADFWARCAEYPDLRNALQDPYLVGAMSAPQLRRAITGPAQAAGFQIEPGLVDLLLHDATGYSGEVALPLLSYALDQIWRSRSRGALTIAAYSATGGINRAVASGADRTYDRLTKSQQTMTRRLFMRLIATSENGEETAHPVNRTELTGSLPPSQAEDLSTVIEAFTSSRLLTNTSDTIAISQVLLRAWPRLRGWLDDFRDGHIVRTQLSEAATEWDHSNRDVAFLYTGSRLAVTQHAMAQVDAFTDQLPLGPIERDFLQASMRSYRRSIRRRHIVMVLLLVLLVGLVTETFILLSR